MRRWVPAAALFWIQIAGSILVPCVSYADPAEDAKDLFSRGRELRLRGDCVGAMAVFREVYAVFPAGLGSLRNIAECAESLGRFSSARQTWLDLRLLLLSRTESKYEGWIRDADRAAARLAPKVSTLTIEVLAKTPSGRAVPQRALGITLNGEPLATNLLNTPLARDPGHYEIQASGDGVFVPQQVGVDLEAGDAKSVALTVVVQPDSARAVRPLPIAPARQENAASSRGTRQTGAWVAFSGGAIALMGAGVSLIVRQSALDEVQSQCPNYATQPCPPAVHHAVDRGNTASTLVNVFGAAAGVGIAAGIVLLATNPKPTGAVAVAINPEGIWARGSF